MKDPSIEILHRITASTRQSASLSRWGSMVDNNFATSAESVSAMYLKSVKDAI
ncbi:MAG TPA: hypothetical protein PLP07_06280 [Pyrinomonadaceae bacterium]|nr:hypothetical protein [Chloracidobacterium sp.]MBP9934838.1 hypothetical protein [Pyrinomonadaceae bacterium]MBK7803263.1 hypothetical protein [Chloracidobacterium sp.]MBK9438091.1 hypothetical protein [Chloracidobacterium sp.]MBL0241039.1 hypothetical protein [Chloracidobacterium sp.]